MKMVFATFVQITVALLLVMVCDCTIDSNSVCTIPSNDKCGARSNGTVTTLYFASMLPYPNSNPALQPSWDEGPTLFLAEQLAVEHINCKRSDVNFLRDYEIKLIQGNSGCDLRNEALGAFVENVLDNRTQKQVVGIIGPGCSTSATAISPLNGQGKIALINIHVAGSLLLTDREKYPYSFGTLDSTEVFVEASIALMQQNNWTRVAALYDESRLYYYSTLQAFEQQVQNLSGLSIAVSSAVYNSYIPFDAILQSRVRVIFLLVGPDFLSRILCLAYHRNLLFPVYQWVIVSRTVDEITNITFTYERRKYSCNQSEIQTATAGTIIIHYRLTPLDSGHRSDRTDTGLTYEQFAAEYDERIDDYNRRCNKSDISHSFWAPAFYDAVWVLAWALNNSIESLHAEKQENISVYNYGKRNITNVVRNHILKLDKEGISGRIMFNATTGYVNRIVDIYQVSLNESRMEIVGYYNTNGITNVGEPIYIADSFMTEIITDMAPFPATEVFLLFVFVSLAALVSTHMLSILYRHHRSVRASSPKLNHLAYIGCYFQVLAAVTYITAVGFDVHINARCALFHTLNVCANLSITLIFGTICAKTWRIYRIFVHFRNPGRLITDMVLLVFVLVNVAVDIAIHAVWISVDRLVPETITFVDREMILARETCRTENPVSFFIWFGILSVHAALLVIGSLLLSILCHSIHNKDFKTKSVIALAYSMSFVVIFGLALYLFVYPHIKRDGAAFIISFTTLCTVLIVPILLCLLFLFLPTVLPVLKAKFWNSFSKKETTV